MSEKCKKYTTVTKGGQRGSTRSGDEDKREQERGGNIPGQDRIRVGRSCVRTGSDNVLSTWWVLKQNTQHGPTGSILITFVIHPQFAHSNTHWVHVEYFQKVPTTEPAKGGLDLPTGSILINFTFCPHLTHPDTHQAHVEYFYKVPTQVPTDCQGGYIQKVLSEPVLTQLLPTPIWS